MEYRKNDMVTLDIVDCGMNGEGIGKADGFTVFVKDAVIGDRITAKIMKAKKNYGYGRLMEILVPSRTGQSRYVLPPVSAEAVSFRLFPTENSLLLKKKRYEATWKESEDLQTFQWNLLLGWTSPFTTEIRLSSQ